MLLDALIGMKMCWQTLISDGVLLCRALLFNLMMKYLKKAPANIAAILSRTCRKPGWKMLIFSQLCPRSNNNKPPTLYILELSVFLEVLLTGWPISEGGIVISSSGWRVPAPWNCGLQLWGQWAGVKLEPEKSWLLAVLGLRFGPFLKSFLWGALNEDKHKVLSLMHTQGRLQRGARIQGLGAQLPLQTLHALGWRSALVLGLGCRMAAL